MDECLDWVGVLASVHSLLPTVYRLWYERVTGRKPPPCHLDATSGAATDFAVLMDADVDGADGAVGDPPGGAAVGDGALAGGDPAAGAGTSAADGEVQKKH